MEFQSGDYKRGGKQRESYSVSEVEYVFCPFCNRNKFTEIYKERGILRLVRCDNCELIYVNPRLKNPEEIYWGGADNYFEEARMIFEGKAKHHRDCNYNDDLKLIQRYKPSGNFLDIGTNMGFFLRNAKGRQWNLFGVEPSPALSEMARRYFGLNVKTGFLDNTNFQNDFFDVITMTDVFEHIPEPHKILKEIHKIIKPDGILFIKIPNALFNLFKFFILRLTGRLKDYDIFDSYEHVIHYTVKTLRNTLKKNAFKILNIYIGKPIQIPVWHNYVGRYYLHSSPWFLDPVRQIGRAFLYILSLIEFKIRLNSIGYLAPNIIVIAKRCDASAGVSL